MATLLSASRSRRSRITRDCTLEPSRPASGESLIETVTATVGGSIGGARIGSTRSGAASVSATVALENPAIATISPASALSTAWRSSPRNARIRIARAISISRPSRLKAFRGMLVVTRPAWMRPVSRRPR